MFMDTPEDERTKLISCLGAFRQYWGTLPQVCKTHRGRLQKISDWPNFFLKWHHLFLQDSHDQCVQWIVRFIHSQHSPKRIAFLYDCLAMAVETSLLPPRYTHTHTNEHLPAVHSHKLCEKSIWWFLLCVFFFLKDCVWSTYRLWQFGVGEDSAVGADLQTHSEDYWRGGLQGLCLPFSLTHKRHINLLATIAFLISS